MDNGKTLFDLFEHTIEKSFHLKRDDLRWILGERAENGTQLSIIAPNRYSLGFTLDEANSPSAQNSAPMPFISGTPPEHIKKMCDAIVVVAYKGKGYLFCIEQKSGYKGDYKKQLVNGAIFCQWLMALFEAHDYFNQKPIYVGLLVFAPRARAERKGLTSHREDKPEAIDPINPFDKCYRMINQNEIRLGELCKIASRSARRSSASSPERGRNGNANHTIFSSSQGPDGY